MTFKYKDVYINETATLAGPYEKKGPLSSYYDETFKDFYYGEKTWEQGESSILQRSVIILLSKINKNKNDIDIQISGDLLNQIVATNYACANIGIPLIGIYGACSTSVLSLIIASNMIDAKQVNNAIVSTSSNNNAAEKQFRYPVEYGAPKPKRTTFTTTGGASCYLSKIKSKIKVDSATVGKVIDMGIKDVFNMGAIMAPSAAFVINKHLEELNRDVNYYDLILTGDLGIYGKDILKEYMEKEYNIKLNNNDDAACMIYDINDQEVYAGGSGPACLPLVSYSYIFDLMKQKKYKHVLLVATGALMNTTMVNQKLSIPSISHAISLEVV